jgi:hypothetical protein
MTKEEANQQQWADNVKLEFQLEQALADAEQGIMLTLEQIDIIRFACGLPAKPRQEKSAAGQVVWNMLVDMNAAIQKGMK